MRVKVGVRGRVRVRMRMESMKTWLRVSMGLKARARVTRSRGSEDDLTAKEIVPTSAEVDDDAVATEMLLVLMYVRRSSLGRGKLRELVCE